MTRTKAGMIVAGVAALAVLAQPAAAMATPASSAVLGTVSQESGDHGTAQGYPPCVGAVCNGLPPGACATQNSQWVQTVFPVDSG